LLVGSADAKELFARLLKQPRPGHFYPLPTPPRPGAPPDLFSGGGEASLYLHIPYCQTRCTYCFFVSQIGLGADDIDAYLSELEQEVALARDSLADYRFSSIYFGGGTPGLLSPDAFRRMVRAIRSLWPEGATATLETHPCFANDKRIAAWREAGVDRVSLGVQTLDPELLDQINRNPQRDETLPALERLLAAGFGDVNVDILYGLPSQTMETWLETVDAMVGAGVPSISVYVTTFVPDTRARFTEIGAAFCNRQTVRDMYHAAFERLKAAGFHQDHYGCSTFSRIPYKFGLNVHRQHVLAALPLVGLGMGAYGSVPGYTYLNQMSRAGYRAALAAGKLPVLTSCAVPATERPHKYAVEAWKMGFLNKDVYAEKFGEELADRFGAELGALVELGEIVEAGREYHLTRQGAARQHVIADMFISPEARAAQESRQGGRTA